MPKPEDSLWVARAGGQKTAFEGRHEEDEEIADSLEAGQAVSCS